MSFLSKRTLAVTTPSKSHDSNNDTWIKEIVGKKGQKGIGVENQESALSLVKEAIENDVQNAEKPPSTENIEEAEEQVAEESPLRGKGKMLTDSWCVPSTSKRTNKRTRL
jgi:hypothetical protein